MSVTVDFAPEAARRPREPTIKYWRVRLALGFLWRYGEKSGTWVVERPDGGTAVVMVLM
jgi:hypothetical protein